MKRWIVYDPFTREVIDAVEAYGQHGSFDDLRRQVEANPRRRVLELSDYDRLTPAMELIATGRALPAEAAIVALPEVLEVLYDDATGWLVPAPRPTWEQANAQTLQGRTDALLAQGVAPGFAPILAEAERAEYDAYDPLAQVLPAGASAADVYDHSLRDRQARDARAADLKAQLEA